METPFVEPESCNNAQLAFLTFVYAVVLFQASGLISGGSELLMLVPSVAGLVGSVVLPILGAVPDGMMVLFSGVGPNAQETVAVGVGALAGSTVMLLTFPWFICILFGRVPLKNGRADYASKESPGLFNSGISFGSSIRKNVKVMLLTTFLYFIIQLPATWEESIGANTRAQASGENQIAFGGLIACVVAFVGYLGYCFADASEDKQLAQVIKGIERKQISIAAALEFISSTREASPGGKEEALLAKDMHRLRKICRPFFARYDFNGDAKLNAGELPPLLHDLGYRPTGAAVTDFLREQDENGDGEVSFDEFTRYLYKFMQDKQRMASAPHFSNTKYMPNYDEDGEEEEEAMPEDLADLSPSQQLVRVILRSLWMMGLGTALVLAFSDPMVECLSEWGKRLNISPFYISFVLAPFASNASELIAAYNYAVKKTEKNISTSLSTLVGAACMNNTFVLGIFLALIYVQKLAWQFTAETVAMVLVQWVIGLMALASKTQNVVKATLILLCYPGCLFIVWFLENKMGWD